MGACDTHGSRDAVDSGTGFEPGVAARTAGLRLRAHRLHDAGEPSRDAWLALLRFATRAGDLEAIACATFHLFWVDRDGVRRARLEHAASFVRSADGPVGWGARAAACLATLEGDYAGAALLDRVALARAVELGDEYLEATAHEKLAVCDAYAGDLTSAIVHAAAARDAHLATGRDEAGVRAWLSLTDMLADALRTEEQVAEAAAAATFAASAVEPGLAGCARAFAASALVNAGRLDEAGDEARAALGAVAGAADGCAYAAATVCQAAHVAVERGDLSGATTLLEDARRRSARFGYVSFLDEVRIDDVRIAAARGDVDAARGLLAEWSPEEDAATARLALWLARIAVRDEAPGLLQLAAQLREGLGASCPLATLALEELHLLLDVDVDARRVALLEFGGAWRRHGRALDAVRCEASALCTGADDTAAALALASAARRLARMGAHGDADRIAALVRSRGGAVRLASRSTSEADVHGLTAREAQVARLVAAGAPNPEVARSLGVRVETVEKHLGTLYRKTGTTTRVRLMHALTDDRDEPCRPTAS
ncbi:MAG: ATPase-like protein [Thermoleophilia bacterium]|nr:ATPase-like protein [Thermoleophilia bacterium]